jgi:hypothetical protein
MPDENEILELAYKATNMYIYGKHGEEYESMGDEVDECRKEQDFTPE